MKTPSIVPGLNGPTPPPARPNGGAEPRAAVRDAFARQPNSAAPAIPGYVLSVPLGHGAMATVWKAVQTRTGRTVAVRVFSESSGVNWPFLRQEVDRLVKVDLHPHILALLDADLDHNPPYDVSELMEGGSLEEFVNPEKRVKAPVVTEWMNEIAHALVFAHGKGIIHGDLKPANVLLDAHGWVRVTEFGQVRILTEGHAAVGSICYMAPEQAYTTPRGLGGSDSPVAATRQPDVRWDLYALGAIAYALLTGKPPHADAVATTLQHTRDLPARLALYRKVVDAHSLRPLKFVQYVDSDLAAIVRKCLEPDLAKRYRSALEVVHDLENRKVHRIVSPHARNPVHHVRTLARRNLPAALVAAAALLMLGAGWAVARANRLAALNRSLRVHAIKMTQLGEYDEAAAYWAELNRRAPTPGARSNALAALRWLPAPVQRLAPDDEVVSLAYNRAGTRVVTGSADGTARIWDAATGQPVGAPLQHKGRIAAVAFSGDGRRVATGSWDRTARVWDAATGHPVGEALQHGGQVTSVSFSPDSAHVATASADDTVGVWATETGKAVGPIRRHLDRVIDVAFNHDGLRVAAASWDGTGQVWCARRTMRLGKPLKHLAPLTAIAFSPDGLGVVTASRDHTARIWNPATGRAVGAVLQHQDTVTAVAWSPDGARIATASADHTVRVWDAATGAPVGAVCRHGDDVLAVTFSPDSRWLATGGKDGVAKIWESSTGELAGFCRQMGWATALAFSPDGHRLAVAAGDKHGSEIWDISKIAVRVRPLTPAEAGSGDKMIAAHPGDVRRLASGTGDYVAVRDGGDLVRIWAVREGVQVGEPLHVGSGVTWLQFSPDDRTLFAGGKDRSVIQAWDTAYLAVRPSAAEVVRDADLRTRYHLNRLGYPEPRVLASF